MLNEGQPKHFRPGESSGKPIGGNVSSEPFPKALSGLARARGFESQSSLATAVGTYPSIVGMWYRGKRTPNPENFGKLLQTLNPNDEEHDRLVDSYGELLQKGLGSPAMSGSEASLRGGQARRISSKTEFGKWIEDFCDARKISLRNFNESLSLSNNNPSFRDTPGLNSLSQFLQRIPEIYGLDEKEVTNLSEAVAKTIEHKLAEGHVFSKRVDTRRVQKSLSCVTYNGEQAAKALGVSRERVRVLRGNLRLPLLLTDNDLDKIRQSVKAQSNTKINRTPPEKM